MGHLKTYASPEARYQHRRWWLTLSLPIGYYYYHVADRLADTSTFITLAPKFSGKFTRWLSSDYRLTYTNNQYKVDAVKAIHSALRQNLSVTLLPTDQWHIAFGAEHYYTRFSTGQTASIIFLDASVRWLLSKSVDISLAATNLLNETDYRYTSFGSLSESLYSFNIRPRNIIIKIQIKI